MRERELRIALVCFGGVSLAVYMHGITKEILKLARASSALHAITDRNKRSSADYFDLRDPADLEYDTESIYFELLRELGRTVELRVIVDIIAGASAGGINGVMLARALSHDLPLGPLRELWMENADVTELLATEARARGWSKWFLRPFFWAARVAGIKIIGDMEVRTKLSLLMRSRWFKPPFDGMKMTAFMYDAVNAMGAPRTPGASLMPSGQGLDLFVTVTDFYGSQQLMQIHDPPVIHEREHRHVLRFKYRRRASGAVESDFDLRNAPGLAFAARATSSIPGAFPPAHVSEMDRLLETRSAAWPTRAEFIAKNFGHYDQEKVDVASVPFIDGAVLNSRPFREAVEAIQGRAAYREVDRRVVYIDPNPAPEDAPMFYGIPGFFSTLKGALSDIPLAEPINDELSWIARLNDRARRFRGIIETARPHVTALVSDVMSAGNGHAINESRIRSWREQANVKAAREAGFAYEAYVRLKLASVRDFVSQRIISIRRVRPGSPFARAIAEIVDAWAIQSGAQFQPLQSRPKTDAAPAPMPRWVEFLLTFDVDYRKRRLRFLIEGQNRLYQMLGSADFEGLDPAAVDRLKRKFYERIEALERREMAASDNPTTCGLVEEIFNTAPSASEIKEVRTYARSFVTQHREQLDRLIGCLGADIDLNASTQDVDLLLCEAEDWPARGLQEVLVNYLGFPFWDVLTFPVLPWREAGEFNEIRVDRISAQDASGFKELGTFPLKGTAFQQFAAFLSRGYRENDYLLGRLHAIDRLIDLVCDAAEAESHTASDIAALKRKAFTRILDAEEARLPTCKDMIAELRAALKAG